MTTIEGLLVCSSQALTPLLREDNAISPSIFAKSLKEANCPRRSASIQRPGRLPQGFTVNLGGSKLGRYYVSQLGRYIIPYIYMGKANLTYLWSYWTHTNGFLWFGTAQVAPGNTGRVYHRPRSPITPTGTSECIPALWIESERLGISCINTFTPWYDPK